MCFMRKCILETTECGNDPTCLKGLSCLARCKGEGTCSTGCFAAYGSERLNKILYCSVEKEDCVKVPRDEGRATWAVDPSDERPTVVQSFDMKSLEGSWYKVMGWDQRYDCFDCQVNSFQTQGAPPGKPSPTRSSLGRTPRKWEIVKNAGSREAVGLFDGLESFIRGKQAIAADEQGQAVAESNNDGYRMKMEVKFTLPRPRDERGYRNEVEEEIIGDGPGSPRSMHSKGRMFGLTFWENYYVVAEGNPDGSFITGNGKFSNPVAPAPVPASPKRSGELTLVSSVAEESAEALKAAGVLRGRLQEAAHSVKSPFWSSKPPLPALPATIQTQTTLTGTPVVDPDQGVAWKFIYYTGHTLQGNYKGAFVYSREPILPAKYEPAIEAAAKQVGLDITQFCRIRNTCFLSEDAPYANPGSQKLQAQAKQKRGWFPIFEMTRSVAQELSDWFGDPTLVSDWLLAQQERVVLQQPLETSPFADLVQK